LASRPNLVPGHVSNQQRWSRSPRGTGSSLALCGAVLLFGACTNDPPEACLSTLPATCSPELNPTYAEIFPKILQPRCGSSGPGCHGEQGRQGNLGLYEINEAYDALLGHGPDGRARVLPGDPECSILMQRLETSDTVKRMPLGGTQLSAGARCAIQQWIEAGAPR